MISAGKSNKKMWKLNIIVIQCVLKYEGKNVTGTEKSAF